MQFGLLYEIQVPRDGGRAAEQEIYRQTIEQVQLAERVGFSQVWAVEHHFLREFSHSSAPEVWFGYLAAATEKIRLGHGVRLLPFPYNHPIKLAEQAAVLDILSGGRLEFGTGRSGTMTELGGFGIDPSQTRAMYDEVLRMMPHMWRDEPFSYSGEYFEVPEREIVPKPVQEPHPPLWAACTSSESHARAGRDGVGLLSFTIALNIEEVARRIGAYREAVKDPEPVGAFVNEQAAVFTLAHCAETPEQAEREAADGIMFYNRTQIEQLATMASDFAKHKGYEYYEKFVGVTADKFTFDYLQSNQMVMVGDPQRCREVASSYRDIGVDHLLLHVQNYGVPHEQVMRSIQLFGDEVLPAFADERQAATATAGA